MNLKQKQSLKQRQYDFLAKVVIIGNSSVGKTNILLRFVQQNYSIIHTPTIGVDFRSKIINVPLQKNGQKKKIKLQLWDTAGQQRFRTLTQTYFNGASGIIITYAVNDRKSFDDVKSWVYQLEENRVQKIPKIIVGNKCDLKNDRTVTCEQGRLIAAQNNCTFMEVSAKEDINITQLFTQLSIRILSNLDDVLAQKDNSSGNQMKTSNIIIKQPIQKKKNCC